MKNKNRDVTVTVKVEYDEVQYIRKIRSKPSYFLAYLMRDITLAGQEIRREIVLDQRKVESRG
ncbi:hypothetical protein LCGC14_3035530 [marine sediment metagenome]|uniref:Uncharacterized protein n=1 Tax=marine sediment metagenome TaxID=412755 RepID=A0A0F8YZ41_9ZZZZ